MTTDDRDALAALRCQHCRDQVRHDAVTLERQRLAREIHDSPAQALAAAQMHLSLLAARPELADLPDIRKQLTDLAELLREQTRDARDTIHDLRVAAQAPQRLVDQLRLIVDAFTRRTGLHADLRVTGLDTLDATASTQLVRITQEALTNVRKHADATRVDIDVVPAGDQIVVTITDDGRGFDAQGVRDEAFGLTSMRQRAEQLGGTLTVVGAPGAGTSVTARIPRYAGEAPHEGAA